MIQVAFYTGSASWVNRAIRFVTRSPFSHCEIVIDGQGYTPKRGYSELYQRRPSEYLSDWELVQVPWDEGAVRQFVSVNNRIDYDLRSLIAHLVPGMHDSIHAQNCSEFIVNLGSFVGDPRFHNRTAYRYAPSDVYRVINNG
tara:strand:- start:142 stop:567 length:426 start_codon:yes stop_codon:yes gene_type:complete